MDKPMTQEESYVERRKLFKNIWETSIQVDEKDDIMNKPKIIKTLRLDEMDRSTAGRKKKQRIKNLRTVCNKLLDFCDRQDADDLYYEQMALQGKVEPPHLTKPKMRNKQIKIKKGLRKAKSMMSSTKPTPTAAAGTTLSEMKDGQKVGNKTAMKTATDKTNRMSITVSKRKIMKPKKNIKTLLKNGNSEIATTSQKYIKKKNIKNKPQFKMSQPGTGDNNVQI